MSDSGYKESTAAWYRQRLEQHGQGIKALSSGTEERRAIRFQVLSEVGIHAGASVLDVGCGFADFYAYLKERGIEVSYSGVDLVAELVQRARRSHPGLDARVRDLQSDPIEPQSYDFVVCSQTFNLRFGDDPQLSLVQDMMRRMFGIARKGLAIDFVTDQVDFRESYLKYYSPEAMFGFAKSLTKRVLLRHDHPLYEFCLYLYPDFAGWGGRG